jgi:hypothetical protein
MSCLTEYYFENLYTFAISNTQETKSMALFMAPVACVSILKGHMSEWILLEVSDFVAVNFGIGELVCGDVDWMD